jgi:hypothetical protein
MASDPKASPQSVPATPPPAGVTPKPEAKPKSKPQAESEVQAPTPPQTTLKPTAAATSATPAAIKSPVATPAVPKPATVAASPVAAKPASVATKPSSTPTVQSAAPPPQQTTPLPSFELPAAIYSPQLLESVTYDIQYYLDWYRQNQIRKQVGAEPKEEPNHSDETVLVIEAWLAGKPPTLESLEALLDYLKKLKLPEVHIMLAALPNRAQREAFVNWFRSNTTPHLFISFVADRNLGGGIVVRTPDHVYDYSWKQELLTGRDKLVGILKRV